MTIENDGLGSIIKNLQDGGGGGDGPVIFSSFEGTKNSANMVGNRNILNLPITNSETVGITCLASNQSEGGHITASFATALGGDGHQIDIEYGIVVGGEQNRVLNFSTGETAPSHSIIVGGEGNTSGGSHSFIGGGDANSIGNETYTGDGSVVVGGSDNGVVAFNGFIGGGSGNFISAVYSFIGGGSENAINTSSPGIDPGFCSIVGGEQNAISDSHHGFIAGGFGNRIDESAFYSSILGGQNNVISGPTHAIVLGGFSNSAYGFGSIAMGVGATAGYAGVRAFASGQTEEGAQGNRQVTEVVLRGNTEGSVPSEETILLSGNANGPPSIIPIFDPSKIYQVYAEIVACESGSIAKTWIRAVALGSGGSSIDTDLVTPLEIGSPPAGWSVGMGIDEAGIRVSFTTGEGNTNRVNLSAYVRMVECNLPS